jgi:hypothetical protein
MDYLINMAGCVSHLGTGWGDDVHQSAGDAPGPPLPPQHNCGAPGGSQPAN